MMNPTRVGQYDIWYDIDTFNNKLAIPLTSMDVLG